VIYVTKVDKPADLWQLRFFTWYAATTGTFVLSNDAHASAWHDAFAGQGFHVPVERLRRMIGLGGDKVLATFGLTLDRPPGETVAHRRQEIFLSHYLRDVRPAPGGRALVERLADGSRCVVASSSQSAERDALLRVARIEDLVETTHDDGKPSKPDPDIVVSALSASGAAPDAAVLIGDTPYDIEAASRAGVATIAVRSGGWDDASRTSPATGLI